MDCDHNFILYEENRLYYGVCKYYRTWNHRICTKEDKYEALKILMRHYHAEDFKFNTDMIKVTTVLKMTVTDMVGKRRNNIH